MALVYANRCKETTTTTGTGTLNLDGAATGFQGFVAGIGDGNTVIYQIDNGTDWEVGTGTVTDATPDTLSRTTILASSNADAAVNWGAGTKSVFCTIAAEANSPDIQTFTASGTWTKPVGAKMINVHIVSGGGSGGRESTGGSNASGAGGGGGRILIIAAADLSATETVTIGAGGAVVTGSDANGNDGGNSSFGAWATEGGFGGLIAAGPANGGNGGDGSDLRGVDGGTNNQPHNIFSGGGGAADDGVDNVGGNSDMGGGGGAGDGNGNAGSAAGGVSKQAGNGGAVSSTASVRNGVAPGGGGAGVNAALDSGAGADGRIIVTTYF